MIASRYLSTFDNPVGQRMARLMVGEVTRSRHIVEIFGNVVIRRVLGFLKGYMARQIELGRLRPHDVRSSARLHRDAPPPSRRQAVLPGYQGR